MEIALIGLNHATAAVDLRERVAFSPEQARDAAARLQASGCVREVLILSTCNRSEVYSVPKGSAADTLETIEEFFATYHGLQRAEVQGAVYRHVDREAVRHLFRVASGLDSMMLGEVEILGQVREAYRLALEHHTTGHMLNRLFQGALEVGKRVRAETEIAVGPMSVASAAVRLAEQIFGRFSSQRALIVGAGAIGGQVVRHLRSRGIVNVRILNRTADNARELADRFGVEVVPWDDLQTGLEWPDMIVSSVSAPDAVLTAEMLERAMASRKNRPLLVIDLGVPRNVSADVRAVYNVYLYDIDRLSEIVRQHKKVRENEVSRAEEIVNEQVEKFTRWQAFAAASSVIAEFGAKPIGERDAWLRKRLAEMAYLTERDHAHVATVLRKLLKGALPDLDSYLRSESKVCQHLEGRGAPSVILHSEPHES
jgi:glutamyl-tRNA reductase